MRVAALYDLHGHLPALEAVLEEVEHEQPDAGPFPRETLEAMLSLGDRVLTRS